jgi:hypothetical protein
MASPKQVFICYVRNDLEDSGLQILDLKPNTSYLVNASLGQTHYLTYGPQHDTVSTSDIGAGERTLDADTYGLGAYLADRVENTGGGNLSLTDAEVVTIVSAIFARVASGLSLTLADVNTAINTPGTVTLSNLTGAGASNSRGALETVLGILSGLTVYKVPAGSTVCEAAGAFTGASSGSVLSPFSTDSRARMGIPIYDTDAAQISCATGQLSILKAATYQWINPAFTYGSGGTAYLASGTNIPVTGIARAVTIYDHDGNVL